MLHHREHHICDEYLGNSHGLYKAQLSYAKFRYNLFVTSCCWLREP